MRPAQAAAGCVALMSAATTAARPARNRRMSASSPAKAGDAGKTTAALGGSPGYRMGYFTAGRESRILSPMKNQADSFGSAEAGGHHRQKDQRAHGELEIAKAPDARAKHAHLPRGSAVTAGSARADLERAVRPPDDRRARRRVDPDREEDPREDRPRPPSVESRQLL